VLLPTHLSERRATALDLREHLQKLIDALDEKVAACAEQRPLARLLMTHPGVGPITGLATETILGDATRFASAKHLCSYVGLIPADESSAQSLRLGKLTKQGSAMLRFLWCEAVAHAVRKDDELKRFYRRKLAQKGMGKAKVAAARKLGVRLWIMLRDNIDYQEFCRRGRQTRGAQAEMPARERGPA
jgi:transposase